MNVEVALQSHPRIGAFATGMAEGSNSALSYLIAIGDFLKASAPCSWVILELVRQHEGR